MRTLYEDVYFYLDLTKDFLRKKDILKALNYYIEEKNKIDIKGHYNILLFQSEGNPIFVTDKKNSENITQAIADNWEFRPKDVSYFENGLFYIFSYIAETIRKESKINRIIIITDTPSDLNEEYQNALFDLVSKIKHFPTFIDIIRVCERDFLHYKDDAKLNILSSDTKGIISYIFDKKELLVAFKKIIKEKDQNNLSLKIANGFEIGKEDYSFYSNLAKELRGDITKEKKPCSLCQEQLCAVCADENDTPSYCPDCSIAFHKCCAINYTIDYNIGIPHIFRCPKCDILLKIDEELVVEVSSNDPTIISVEDLMKEEFIQTPEHLANEFLEPRIIEVKDLKKEEFEEEKPTEIREEKPTEIREEKPTEFKPKVVRVGGFFSRAFIAKRVGDKIVYERATKKKLTELEIQNQESKIQTYQNQSLQKITRIPPIKKDKPKIRICHVCGAIVNLKVEGFCHKCRQKL